MFRYYRRVLREVRRDRALDSCVFRPDARAPKVEKRYHERASNHHNVSALPSPHPGSVLYDWAQSEPGRRIAREKNES